MNAEFNWWLLIVGLVVGAALVYLILADAGRREAEVTAEGVALEPRTAERVLELHRVYLSAPPPDDPLDDEPPPVEPPAGSPSAVRDDADVERD